MHIAIFALGVRFFQEIPHCCDHSCPLCGSISSGSRTCLEVTSAQELINVPLVCTWCVGRSCLQLCPVPESLQTLEKKKTLARVVGLHWEDEPSSSGRSSCLWTPTDGWGRDFGLGLGSASDEQGFSLPGNAMMPGSVMEGDHDSPWGSAVNCLAFFRGTHKWRLLWLLLVPPGHLPARTTTESHHFPWHGGVLVFLLSPLLKTNKHPKTQKQLDVLEARQHKHNATVALNNF